MGHNKKTTPSRLKTQKKKRIQLMKENIFKKAKKAESMIKKIFNPLTKENA